MKSLKQILKFNFQLFLLCILFISCTETKQSANLNGYSEINLDNGVQIAEKFVQDSILEERGYLSEGVKNGVWISYFKDNKRIQTIHSYTNGKLNGPSIELNNRGQIVKHAEYKNDILHGLKAEYKFGRPLKESNYNEGQIHGVHKEYFDNGKIQKEVMFKNGAMDGSFKQFNDTGELNLEYMYKNGTKISGGIVK